MRRLISLILLVICLMTLVSCKQRREAIRQLGCAQAIMETAPDSALVFLDSIRSHPGVLDKRHRMEYETAMVQADVCMRNGENTRCRWRPIKKR